MTQPPPQPYIIAPLDAGLQTNPEPWLIPEKAFSQLTNAYVWRGRVRKKFGTRWMGSTFESSQLGYQLGTTTNTDPSTFTAAANAANTGISYFTVGTETFTITLTTNTDAPLLRSDPPSGTVPNSTYNYTTGALSLMRTQQNVPVRGYNGLPVMGFGIQLFAGINISDLIVFDTTYSYHRVADNYIMGESRWSKLALASGLANWTGTDGDFFFTVNMPKALNDDTIITLALNNVPADGLRYLENSTWTKVDTRFVTTSNPQMLLTARFMITYIQRLFVFNTVEGTSVADGERYQSRIRWSEVGVAITQPGWETTSTGSNYIDLPTAEAIISVGYLKNDLFIYCQNSVWRLTPQSNRTNPFFLQRINANLGAESPFSIVQFDTSVVAIGSTGIHACDGVNVKRIDDDIPRTIFSIRNEVTTMTGNPPKPFVSIAGANRVHAFRDLVNELVYWTLPTLNPETKFPSELLLWNYKNNTWAIIQDNFTAFGQWHNESTDSWRTISNFYPTWSVWDSPWQNGADQINYPRTVGGNQQGVISVIDHDLPSASAYLSIRAMNTTTQVIQAIRHNFLDGDCILIEDASGITFDPPNRLLVVTRMNADNFTVNLPFTGTYRGGGLISKVFNYNIVSKDWNPETAMGSTFRIPYIDFLIDKTMYGEISIDYAVDANTEPENTEVTGAILGSRVLLTRDEDINLGDSSGSKLWHRFYLQSEGFFLRIKLYLNEEQLSDLRVARSDFQLNAILLHVHKGGRIIG